MSSSGPSPGAARLLPWSTPDGKPCYVNADERGGPVSQLAMGRSVLGHARAVMDDAKASRGELRYTGVRLAECLTDALRVAESRGNRLSLPDHSDGGTVLR
ncbi:hypothetical protein ACQUSR_14215 [Streptomyces sp. P1-3]|uniref:hypothetical protein n=1 Tax=Streptomyces sp. P1-3 TaxID=3421658 RepID=UPI003D36995D